MEKDFNRANISKRDFEAALRFLDEIKKIPNSTQDEALLISAIIAYCRPFSHNEKDPKDASVKISSDIILSDYTEEEKELHDKLIQLRNKAIAHSEYSYNPTKINPKTKIIASRCFSVLTENINLEIFKGLTNKANSNCCNYVANNVNKLEEQYHERPRMPKIWFSWASEGASSCTRLSLGLLERSKLLLVN